MPPAVAPRPVHSRLTFGARSGALPQRDNRLERSTHGSHHMSTIRWSKQYENVTLAQIRAGARTLTTLVKQAKDADGDGLLNDKELLAASRGQPRAVRSALMGLYASTYGNVHNDAEKQGYLDTLQQGLTRVRKADTNHDGVLQLAELKTLQGRNAEHQVELGWTVRP